MVAEPVCCLLSVRADDERDNCSEPLNAYTSNDTTITSRNVVLTTLAVEYVGDTQCCIPLREADLPDGSTGMVFGVLLSGLDYQSSSNATRNESAPDGGGPTPVAASYEPVSRDGT